MAVSSDVEPRALFGIETEYALTVWAGRRSARSHERGAELLLESMCENPHLRCGGGNSGIFLSNGARFYVDAGYHPEYCTPEMTNPHDAVRQVAAGDRLLLRAAEALAGPQDGAVRFLLTKCNVDYSGSENSWGQHDSYACRRAMPEVAEGMVAHLVTRVLFAGAGGLDNHGTGIRFVLSPRAMHLGTVFASSSTSVRGIVHFRDESHAAPPWRRLHLTYGEAPCSQLAMFLKVGTTSLVVLTLDYAPGAFAHLLPDDALHAAVAVAKDVDCDKRLRVRDGRSLSAIEIQKEILDTVEEMAAAHPYPQWTAEVCRLWRSTLERLTADPMSLVGALDWPTKLALYRDHLARAGFDEGHLRRCNQVNDWLRGVAVDPDVAPSDGDDVPTLLGRAAAWYEARRVKLARAAAEHSGIGPEEMERFDGVRAQMCEIDYRYGALGSEGIFESLDASGALSHRVVAEEEIVRAMRRAPADTRAKRRGAAVAELDSSRDRVRCDWTGVVDAGRARTLDLRDPFRHDVDWVAQVSTPTRGAAELLNLEEMELLE